MPSPAPFEPQGNAAGSRIGMNELISDFSTHPLVPGALFASIIGDPQSRRTEPLDHAALLSYERTARGTVDLLESLFDSFRKIVGGAWSVFFPRSEFSLVTDASAQFWMACLYSSRTDEMVNGFVGLFLLPHRDRLQALNRGYVKQSGLHLRDAITEYLDNAKEKIIKLHEAVADSVKEGLDRSFAEMVRVLNKIELPPFLIFYYEFLTREVCQAFANMDGDLSSKENRFIQYLLRQISVICEDYDPASAGHPRAVPEEKLEQVPQ